MAKYRQIQTYFYNDGFVLELTQMERFFYLFLLTNPNTSQCGVYELPKKIIELYTALDGETVDKLLKKFEDCGKIKYCNETFEIMILNWVKYNEPNNPNAIKCVNNELRQVKNKEYVKELYQQCVKNNINVNQIFDGVKYMPEGNFFSTFEGACEGLPSKEVISNKEEIISNKQEAVEVTTVYNNATTTSLEEVLIFFEGNMYKPGELECKKITAWSKYISNSLIILAIKEAVNYNARNLRYIEKIINRWVESGFKTAEDIINNKKPFSKPKGLFNCFEQRSYDFKKLEKQLLGWA